MTWTDPRTWLAGEEPDAATLNLHIRDQFKALTEWTAYTPTFTSTGTQPTIGNGGRAGFYIQAGDLVFWKAKITIGSTTTAGTGNYLIGVPVPATASNQENFAAQHFRAAGRTACVGYLVTATTVALQITGGATLWAATLPAAPASGDFATVSGVYQAA